jgi:hypothetical protein
MLEKINWACPLAAVYFTHNFSEIAIFFSIGGKAVGLYVTTCLPAKAGLFFRSSKKGFPLQSLTHVSATLFFTSRYYLK